MARIFIDGFEGGSTGLWDSAVGTTIQASTLLTGSYNAILGELTKNIYGQSAYVGFRMYLLPAATTSGLTVSFYNNATLLCQVIFIWTNSNNTLTCGWSDGDDESGSYAYVTYNSAVHLQFHFDNVAKTITIKADGRQVVNDSFTLVAPSHFNKIQFIETTGTGWSTPYIDDVVIDDSEWPGETQIFGLIPNADGDLSQWTPSAGSDHYALVDEIPPNTTDYIQSDTVGAVDLFDVPTIPVGDQIIKSVQAQAYGSCAIGESYKICVKTSGEVHYGCSGELNGGAYKQAHYLWDNNPVTSGEWTIGEINAIQAGIEFMDV